MHGLLGGYEKQVEKYKFKSRRNGFVKLFDRVSHVLLRCLFSGSLGRKRLLGRIGAECDSQPSRLFGDRVSA
jgi:hypothetical protein